MKPDDDVCMCFHVSLRKLQNYVKREEPSVASLLSECLGAGTGCGWCRPFLERLHEQWEAGEELELTESAGEYAECREAYREKKRTERREARDAEDATDA